MVWVIRQRRPDVLITRFPPDARAGHGHHQASAILAAEAFDAAGDPKRFPEQLKYVQAWQPKRLYWNTGSYFVKPGEKMDGYLQLDAGGYNPLLGQSYGEIAARSRSQHRSQGFGSAAQRGEAIEYFQFVKGTPAKTNLFEGIDQTWTRYRVTGMAKGMSIGKMIDEVIQQYNSINPALSVPALVELREIIQTRNGSQEMAFWQDEKVNEMDLLIAACLGLHTEAVATNAAVAAGQAVAVTAEIVNQGPSLVTVSRIRAKGFGCDTFMTKELKTGQTLRVALRLPVSKQVPPSQPYWLREPGTTGMYIVPTELPIAQTDIKMRKESEPKTWITLNRQLLIGQPETPLAPSVTVEFAL
jgi:hypothetical protein